MLWDSITQVTLVSRCFGPLCSFAPVVVHRPILWCSYTQLDTFEPCARECSHNKDTRQEEHFSKLAGLLLNCQEPRHRYCRHSHCFLLTKCRSCGAIRIRKRGLHAFAFTTRTFRASFHTGTPSALHILDQNRSTGLIVAPHGGSTLSIYSKHHLLRVMHQFQLLGSRHMKRIIRVDQNDPLLHYRPHTPQK